VVLLILAPVAGLCVLIAGGSSISDRSVEEALRSLRAGDAAPARELLHAAQLQGADEQQAAMLEGMVALAEERWHDAEREFAAASK
jgi:hypothetical protein